MTTTCQAIIDRAKQFSPLNASLASDPVELLTRIQQDQQRIFTAIASLPIAILGRSRFTDIFLMTSSAGSSDRFFVLFDVQKPVERLLRVVPNGVEAHSVTQLDTNTQLPPRYYVIGATVFEVGSDWSTNPGPVSVLITYAYGAAAIAPTGGTSQLVTVPDEWVDLLILPLAAYFHQKDPGRDPVEYAAITQRYADVWHSFSAYVTNFSGEVNLAAMLPPPLSSQTLLGGGLGAPGGG